MIGTEDTRREIPKEKTNLEEGLLAAKLRFRPYWREHGYSPLASREVSEASVKLSMSHPLGSSWGQLISKLLVGALYFLGSWPGLWQNFLETTCKGTAELIEVSATGCPTWCKNKKKGKTEAVRQVTSHCGAPTARLGTKAHMAPPGTGEMSKVQLQHHKQDHEGRVWTWQAGTP